MSPSAVSQTLFQPIKIGNITLNHRVVLSPLTRLRAKLSHEPILPMVKEYYSQRSRVPGSLLITEATLISAKAGSYYPVPGIWSEGQIKAWKEIVDEVHSNGSYIFLQLWALGRTADVNALKTEDSSYEILGPSPIPLGSHPFPMVPATVPKEMTVDEIKEHIQFYAQAAKNAVFQAGFDGVEIHGANGYLVDQFLQDVSNQRTDQYGGNIEARSRFGLEVVDAVVAAVGPERTAIRLSPWSEFQDMGMEDPVPQFSHFISTLKFRHPKLAYLHVIEPRISAHDDVENPKWSDGSNDFIRAIWSPRPLISAGGYKRESAMRTAHENTELIAFGRYYISNPDLPLRLKQNIPLSQYDRNTFYGMGDQKGAEIGYIDYPFAETGKETDDRF